MNGRIVYYTPNGEKYHFSKECAGENARETLYYYEVQKREPCKKCGCKFTFGSASHRSGAQDGFVHAVTVAAECLGLTDDDILIITADHGNAEEILDDNGKPFTAHTTNLVPFCINRTDIELVKEGGKLANIAPTIIDLLGDTKPVEMNESSLIIHK